MHGYIVMCDDGQIVPLTFHRSRAAGEWAAWRKQDEFRHMPAERWHTFVPRLQDANIPHAIRTTQRMAAVALARQLGGVLYRADERSMEETAT